MKNKILAIIVCVILALCLSYNCIAADITNEKAYKPLDLVVVMDASGSMRDSDSKRTAPDAVRMLVNMMPAADSRVGIISFNRQPTPLTTDAKGNATLIALEDYAGVETIRDDVASIQYAGATGIGNAVFSATELLNAKSDDEHTKAIILFTDGVNDFGNNQLALSECDSNEVSAIKWAKDNNCYIYCVGYDYVENGVSSMGANGEGLLKLQNISSSTSGKFKAIHNISEIEQLLIEFLADVCDLNYKTIATIPGDGKHHECPIAISPSVVEANIRIAGGAENAIANGKIKLFDPSGNEVELRNSGNIRFDTDATAASIKVIMPKAGDWLLTVEGISGDDIHVGLLEHFKMNLTSQLSFPDGNPEGVAYTNDVIGIKTWLTYDGESLAEEAIYDAVTSAEAICVSRADPNDKKTIQLSRDGLSFVGSFTIPEDCFYDITVRLDWDTVYREDTLTVASSNKPLYLTGQFPDVRVNTKKTFKISNIYQYVADDENDAITASITSLSSPDTADISIIGNDLIVTGKKMSSSLVVVTFTDAQGNTVDEVFKVKVNNPLVWVVLSLFILLCFAIAILIPYLSYQKSLKIRGKLYLTQIDFCQGDDDYDNTETFDFTDQESYEDIDVYEDALYIPMDKFYRRKQKRNVDGLISETIDLFRGCEIDTDEYNAKAVLLSKTAKELFSGCERSKVVGSLNGASFTVKINKGTPYLTVNKSSKSVNVENGKKVEISFVKKSDSSSRNRTFVKLHYLYSSPVRTGRNKK